MIEIYLLGQEEKIAGTNPRGLNPPPLYHQIRTAEALRNSPLVMNTYNTGTGKTKASLLHLFELAGKRNDNVLFIAPTNELIHQHYEDICEFVEANNLEFRPVEINAAVLKSWHSEDRVNRGGETFVDLIRSNGLGDPFYKELGIDPTDQRKLPLILVTNPDLFYYALFWQFSRFDQRNLFQTFITSFRYVVIDEFHYYSSKQLANFLFFMALSKEWGYFAEGRRICLLSATPDSATRAYLERLFGPDGWTLISPDNEPAEAADLQTTPVLAPLKLRLESGAIDEYARNSGASLNDSLRAGDHGALIANALWRINQAYDALHRTIGDEKMGRITGAQPVEQRRADQFKALILATPTVDIGYNFKKVDKPRQNLDFVVLEARFQDELIQRMGRAGRVLGKAQTDVPSLAVALVSEDAIALLRTADGTTITRAEFTALLQRTSALPIKDDFQRYVSQGGLAENVYPIYRLREMFAPEEQNTLEELFGAVQAVYAPSSRREFRGIVAEWNQMRTITNWLRDPNDAYTRSKLPKTLADYIEWATGERPAEADVRSQLKVLLAPPIVDGFRIYCEMQQARMRTQFSFRDSFSGPETWVYDPQRLLSGAEVTQYDLIHLVENYNFDMLERGDFQRASGVLPPEKSLCVRLHGHRQERLRVSLRWTPPTILPNGWNTTDMQRSFVSGRAQALTGLLLAAQEPLPESIRQAISRQYVLALIVPGKLNGHLRGQTRHRAVYSRQLHVDLTSEDEVYEVVLGTNALLLEPLLDWAFRQAERDDGAIIL